MTFRQMGAWREIIERQRIAHRAQSLHIMRAAFGADQPAFKRYLKKLTDES
jgi:hypothetical protein